MGFVNPSSKIERAVRNFLILQGKADAASTHISNGLPNRTFPNRTILATVFNPTVPYRQGGVVYFSIQHHFSVAQDPANPNPGLLRAMMDAYVGDTVDSMTISDGNSLQPVADGITAAGRLLIDGANEDMTAFRCDWIKMETPFLTRGKTDEKGTYWVEILNFSAFVSQATN